MTRVFRPFGREGDVAAGGGHFFALAADDTRSIRVYDPIDGLIRIVRVEVPREPADAAAVGAWVEGWMDVFWNGSEAVEAWWRFGFREIPPPDYVPVFRGLEVDTQGNICAERYPLRFGAGTSYWCFTPTGEFVGGFHLPDGVVRLGPHPISDPQLEIGLDHVLGVWEDSLDVQHVRQYRLRRR